MERRNISNEFLKECIADALIQLMKEKPLESITITEITALAGVGRSTYYRNFTSKEDILCFKIYLLGKRWMQKTPTDDKPDSADLIRSFCCYLCSIRELLDLLYQNDQIYLVCTTLYNVIGPSEQDDKKTTYRKAFQSFGIFGIVFQWLKGGMEEGPEELARLIDEENLTKS
ncbi:MAG: TetR/AcrR family transcriptional regulator [Lachnospiraceae bacterium]|nr:TetR/AcrR family transcriptional regulator [Lachnospiraceae bacterium]MDY4971343.1 TetR/AcrR family transcriptional regulator [Lachnospiraceae bacterium]